MDSVSGSNPVFPVFSFTPSGLIQNMVADAKKEMVDSFLNEVKEQIGTNVEIEPINEASIKGEWATMEADIADEQQRHPEQPEVDVAKKVIDKWRNDFVDKKIKFDAQKRERKEPSEKLHDIFGGPDQPEELKGKPLKIRRFDKQQGKVVTTTISPDDYNIRILTEEQYSRISAAAIRALDRLSTTLQQHQERMKEIEVEGKYPLGGRVSQKEDTANKAVLDLMKNQTQHFLSMQRKKENRQKELQQEEQYREEQDSIKRRTQQADLKFEGKIDQNRRDDIQKEEAKKDWTESQENKAA